MSNLELENKALKEKVETLELRVKVLQCITFCGNELLVSSFLDFFNAYNRRFKYPTV